MKVLVEFLYHFQCSLCKGWWTIGDFQWAYGKKVVCPHCAYAEALKEDPILIEGHLLDTTDRLIQNFSLG